MLYPIELGVQEDDRDLATRLTLVGESSEKQRRRKARSLIESRRRLSH